MKSIYGVFSFTVQCNTTRRFEDGFLNMASCSCGMSCLLLLALLTLIPIASRAAECTSSFADMWESDFGFADRAYIVELKNGGADGTSFFSQCLAKCSADGAGSSASCEGRVANPYIETKLHRSMFWQFSKLGCKAETELLGLKGVRRSLSSSNSSNSSKTSGSSNSSASTSTSKTIQSCESYSKYDGSKCEYPGPPAGLELIPDRGTEQDSWYGPLLQVTDVNGEGLNDAALDTTQTIKHERIQGINGATKCTKTEGGRTLTFYNGGVMGEIRRSANLVYRSFQFKKTGDREEAMAISTDTVNPGLKYAHSFAGINGCSIEIVLEVSIKAGGGVSVVGSFPLESMALEREKAVRGSVSLCKTEKEIIAFAGIKQLREAQNVEYDPTCETGNREILRFSRTFVCKATGQSVEASFEFNTKTGVASKVSSDCTKPTPYMTGTPGTGMKLHEAPSFTMTLTAAQAPESCGAMYWDPLLAPLDFGKQTMPAPTQFSGEAVRATGSAMIIWSLLLFSYAALV